MKDHTSAALPAVAPAPPIKGVPTFHDLLMFVCLLILCIYVIIILVIMLCLTSPLGGGIEKYHGASRF